MSKAAQDKNGLPIMVELTDEEKDAITLPYLTNAGIAALRTAAYREQCDPLLAAYYAYTELKEKGKADEMYAAWLARRAEVQAMYPYNEE